MRSRTMPALASFARPMLLVFCAGMAVACDERFAVWSERMSTVCFVDSREPLAVVASEFECVLRCSLDPSCGLSVYFEAGSACATIHRPPSTTYGGCRSGVIARRKLISKLATLNFSSQFLLWYDFRTGFTNTVNTAVYRASPFNIAEQNGVDGVRLFGSNSSYIMVSTPGLYRFFYYGQTFSFFFKGKFAFRTVPMCISAFVDIDVSDRQSVIYVTSDARIFTRMFFANGTVHSKFFNSSRIKNPNGVQQAVSMGINYAGEDFAATMYFNGSALGRSSWGKSFGADTPLLPKIHDTLLIGKCLNKDLEPFDGWLQCWGLLTGNLDMDQFN